MPQWPVTRSPFSEHRDCLRNLDTPSAVRVSHGKPDLGTYGRWLQAPRSVSRTEGELRDIFMAPHMVMDRPPALFKWPVSLSPRACS